MKFTQKIVVIVLVIFVAVPLAIQLHLAPFYKIAKLLTPSNRSEWLSFWGSYLGVIPSGIIAALVAGYQIKSANKQNNEARKQDLIIMRNTKIVDYLYDIKMSVSKSKLILDKSELNLSDKFMFDYMMDDEYNLFGKMNFNVLKDQNNHLYFLTGIVFDLSTDKKLFEGLNEYTKNLKSLQKFINFYEYEVGTGIFINSLVDAEYTKLFNEIRDEEKLKMMIGQLDEISKIVDKRIKELSA